MLDRVARPWVLRLNRLEEVKDVLRARCRPKGEEIVVRVGEGPTAADRHEARVPHLREDHGWHSFLLVWSEAGEPWWWIRKPGRHLPARGDVLSTSV
jgi:hypothetical protein